MKNLRSQAIAALSIMLLVSTTTSNGMLKSFNLNGISWQAAKQHVSNAYQTAVNAVVAHPYISTASAAIAAAAGYGLYKAKVLRDKKIKMNSDMVNAGSNSLPLVFHKDYDISFFGLEKLHPFDSCKYGKIFKFLTNHYQKDRFIKPEKISDLELEKVHSKEYLASLSQSSVIARITELALLQYVPNFILQRCLIHPMKLATGGTVLSAQLALHRGWSINLSGGYHHAKRDSGGGFCAFADIPLAVTKILEEHKDYKVMIVDLDAHQGNGHESYFDKDDHVIIYDIYNEQNRYPRDYETRKRINYNYPVNSGIKDAEYLELLHKTLPAAIDKSNPNMIIYNAGTDIFEEDRLGEMKISAYGIKERDQFVFEQARSREIPISMVLSGGYTKKSADIIGDSVHNILQNVLKVR